MIDELKIKEGLQTECIGQNIVYCQSVDSTNLLAKRQSHLAEGTLFVADCQTNGRGRLGREWHSQKDRGIYMSLLLKPEIPPNDVSKITLLCGIAISRIIKNSKIKYPNDILLNSKKICGILCEVSYDQNYKPVVICGVGINVSNKSFDAVLSEKATSLYLETGIFHSREDIIQSFLAEFEKLYKTFMQSGITPLMAEYKEKCINIGTQVRATYKSTEISGECIDITNDGAIVIKTENGKVEINTGEVSVRGVYGYV